MEILSSVVLKTSPVNNIYGAIENSLIGAVFDLAEAVRFELTDSFPSPVFKTGAIDHSATLPSP